MTEPRVYTSPDELVTIARSIMRVVDAAGFGVMRSERNGWVKHLTDEQAAEKLYEARSAGRH